MYEPPTHPARLRGKQAPPGSSSEDKGTETFGAGSIAGTRERLANVIFSPLESLLF